MKQRHLFSLSSSGAHKEAKAKLAAEVEELIGGMVFLKIPDELAWSLFIESKDAENIGQSTSYVHVTQCLIVLPEDYDYEILRQFIHLFPTSALAKFVKAYFDYYAIPLAAQEEEEEAGAQPAEPDPDIDYAGIIIVCLVPFTRHRRLSTSLTIASLGGILGVELLAARPQNRRTTLRT